MATNIVTKKAKEKIAKARVGLIERLPIVQGFAFGNGGVDSSGAVLEVDVNATTLNNEIYRRPYESYEFISPTTCRYTISLGEDELTGQSISEIGLYDSDGDLINVKHFLTKGKDADLMITFYIDDEF